jgi:hypothetical protein
MSVSTKKKLSAPEKKLKSRCLRHKNGTCVSRYTKKQIKLLLELQKEYKDYKEKKKTTNPKTIKKR